MMTISLVVWRKLTRFNQSLRFPAQRIAKLPILAGPLPLKWGLIVTSGVTRTGRKYPLCTPEQWISDSGLIQ
jgi:hypothetical protein